MPMPMPMLMPRSRCLDFQMAFNIFGFEQTKRPQHRPQICLIQDIQDLKGALSGLRQLLAIENPFYFTSKALFVLKIFKFLS